MGSGSPAYSVSRAALNAQTRILAAELRGDDILVNSVCPGWVATDMGGPGGRPVDQGAASVMWAVLLPDGSCELFPSNMRAGGQGLAYNVGRGLAALGPGFIGITADSIGLGESIVIVGLVACTLAIICCWLLPETRGKVIVEDDEHERERAPRAPVAAASS